MMMEAWDNPTIKFRILQLGEMGKSTLLGETHYLEETDKTHYLEKQPHHRRASLSRHWKDETTPPTATFTPCLRFNRMTARMCHGKPQGTSISFIWETVFVSRATFDTRSKTSRLNRQNMSNLTLDNVPPRWDLLTMNHGQRTYHLRSPNSNYGEPTPRRQPRHP